MRFFNRTKPAAQETDEYFVASQWQLMWWKFRQHKVAVTCAVVCVRAFALHLCAQRDCALDREILGEALRGADALFLHSHRRNELARLLSAVESASVAAAVVPLATWGE